MQTPNKMRGYSLTSTITIVALLAMVICTCVYFYLSQPIETTSFTPTTPKQYAANTQQTVDVAPLLVTNEPETIQKAEKEEKVVAPAAKQETSPTPSPVVEKVASLPLLDDSDAMVLASTKQLLTSKFTPMFIKKEMIRNLVVFVDNVARGELVTRFSPLTKPNEHFSVFTLDNVIYLNTNSYNRYNQYAQLFDAVQVIPLVKEYRRLQSLFDQAYQEIGYPDGKFEDKLLEAIEVINGAPIIGDPIALVSPSVMYKFVDSDLEALPAAQKLFIRMGPDNTLKIQAKLKQIKQALTEF